MVVLVVSTDFEFVRVLTGLLLGDGCAVVACAAPAQARELTRPYEAAALVIDHRADGDALSLVAELRTAGLLIDAAPVVFLCDDVSDWVRIAEVGARLVVKPASLLDIVDLVRAALPPPEVTAPKVAPRAALSAPTARRGEAMANARMLTRWWATRATGVVCVDGRMDGWSLLAQGGPVGQDGMAAIEHALAGGHVRLDCCEVDEPGDRGIMARLLWRAARDAVAGESVISLIPVPNGLTRAVGGLPLTPETRRCLERLGGISVERIARRERSPVVEVAADMAALRWLGLLGLRDPLSGHVEVEIDTPSGRPVVVECEEDKSTPSSPSRDAPGLVLDRLVRDGIAAVTRGDWERADELLGWAHHRALDNAVVAAHLGWARVHNPDVPPARRLEEGTVLVEQALQIDPDCALAWRYCGELAALRGDMAEAARCFGVALRLLS